MYLLLPRIVEAAEDQCPAPDGGPRPAPGETAVIGTRLIREPVTAETCRGCRGLSRCPLPPNNGCERTLSRVLMFCVSEGAGPQSPQAQGHTQCAGGGIGRRAGFRFQCPQGRGGSTPPSRTAGSPAGLGPAGLSHVRGRVRGVRYLTGVGARSSPRARPLSLRCPEPAVSRARGAGRRFRGLARCGVLRSLLAVAEVDDRAWWVPRAARRPPADGPSSVVGAPVVRGRAEALEYRRDRGHAHTGAERVVHRSGVVHRV